ncbi:MAG TPA: cupredoxin family copper-binding protein [Rubrobacteraceae bacterium]|nr:cupredoxin family copper-binding protein [Rubrobacteraceae bacterium]
MATLSVFAVAVFASAAGAQPSYPQDQMMQPQDQMTQPQAPAAQPQYAAPQMQAPAPSAPAAGAQDQQSISVNVQNFAFDPPNIVVAPGTTVTWVNADRAPHTVTATDPAGAFDSGTLRPGQSFSFTFTQPGTSYAYYCAIHPSMTGTVTVAGGGGTAAARAGGTAARVGGGTAVAQAGGTMAQAGGGAAAQASGTGGPQLAATGGPPLLVPLAGLLVAGVGVLGLAVRRRAS